MNLVEGLHHELVRNKELLKVYEEIPTGAFGAMFIKEKIKKGEEALGTGDVVEMARAYVELKESK